MTEYKNPDWTDAMREKNYSTRVDTWRDVMNDVWEDKGADNIKRKAADFIEKLRPKDSVNSAMAFKIVVENENTIKPIHVVPRTAEEKWYRGEAIRYWGAILYIVRNSDECGHISAITIYKADEWNGDFTRTLLNARPKKIKSDEEILKEWLRIASISANKSNATRLKTIKRIKENGEKSEEQRQQEKRQAIQRRKEENEEENN